MDPNLFLQKCKQQHLDKLKEVKTSWVLVGASSSGHSIIAYWLHQLTKSCNLWLMLDLWPLKYPCANMDPNLFLQECKQQHLDKLKEVKSPWVLVGASNSGHSMIAYWLHQLTKSNILWFLLDLWPLKYPCANMDPNLFLQECKQQYWDKLNEVKTPWVLVGAASSKHIKSAYRTAWTFIWPLIYCALALRKCLEND